LFEGSGKLWDEAGDFVHDGNFLGGKVDADWNSPEESISSDVSDEKTPNRNDIRKLNLLITGNTPGLDSSKQSWSHQIGRGSMMANRTKSGDSGPQTGKNINDKFPNDYEIVVNEANPDDNHLVKSNTMPKEKDGLYESPKSEDGGHGSRNPRPEYFQKTNSYISPTKKRDSLFPG
jgi:hypothetical protein